MRFSLSKIRLAMLALITIAAIAVLLPSGRTTTIEMTDQGFYPSEVTIKQGDTVLFKSTGELAHWPASNFHPTHTMYPGSDIRACGTISQSLLFDACDVVEPGEEYRFTFHEAGVWNFHDHIFARNSGRVTVEPKRTPRSIIHTAFYKPTIQFLASISAMFGDDRSNAPIGLNLSNKRSYPPGHQFSDEELQSDIDYENTNIFHLVVDDLEAHRVVKQLGLKRTLEKIYEESEDGTLFRCHQGAHYIGHAAYNLYGLGALSLCTPLCSSGCYHGVTENWLIAEGGAGIIPKITDTCSNLPSQYERDQCFHGAGHGFTAYTNYDIPKTIELCQKLPRDDQQSQCYSGVFMENLMAGGGQGLLEGHVSDWVSWDDPHFPCDAIGDDSEVLRRCYERQTTWMFVVNDLDASKVIPECLDAPEAEQDSCFFGIGRDTAGIALGSSDTVRDVCSAVPSRYQEDCALGAANILVRDWSNTTAVQSNGLCSVFSGEIQTACFDYVIAGARDVYPLQSDRIAFCEQLDEPYDRRCIE